jgi:hypothetical protein
MRACEGLAQGRLLAEQLAGEHSGLLLPVPAEPVAMALTAGTVARTVPHRSMGRF